MTEKRIICLANSRKLSGRCIAGKEIIKSPAGTWAIGPWVRPVSGRPHEEVSESDRQYQDGSDPKVLDVIDIEMLSAKPNSYQSENWLLDERYYWTKKAAANFSIIRKIADPVGPLWLNNSSTYHGRFDRIDLSQANTLTDSLRLIHVDSLALSVFAPSAAYGNFKRRVQARFDHDGVHYRLWVTDPKYEAAYLAMPDNTHSLGECMITVSLGEAAQDGFCYKLVAAIIENK